jgi:hypothetical protein
LVCIDGSTESKLGLFHALDLMNSAEDSIILVHAAKKSRGLTSRLPWRSSSTEPQPAATTPAVASPTPAEQEPEPDSVKRGKGKQKYTFQTVFLYSDEHFPFPGYLAHAGNLVKQWGEEVKWSSRFIEAKDPREAICDLAIEEKVLVGKSARAMRRRDGHAYIHHHHHIIPRWTT